jgi:diguanylate cyclase (GGDEF)-like protein
MSPANSILMDEPVQASDVAAVQGHSIERLSGIARAIAAAPDLTAALETLATELARALHTRVSVFERAARGWMLAAQSGGRLRATLSDLDALLNARASDPSVAPVDIRLSGEGIWTSVWIEEPGVPAIVVLIAGDWMPAQQTLAALAVLLSFAFRYARERAGRCGTDRILVQSYALGRRLSRAGDVDTVCESLVDQLSRALKADRVALALYRPEEERLAVAATRGYPASTVRDVRIEPGAWVIGHVYLTGRPVLVRDAGPLHVAPLAYRHYRTSSFAAAPLFADGKTLGVVTATDKRDGKAFDHSDALALRAFSVSGALAIHAAQRSAAADRLAYAAAIDMLTGLYNRHYLDARLHQELERARRAGTHVTLLLIDIDDFKKVNDTRGHQVGDAILRAVGGILRSAVRVFDVCARFGGDEFAILMPSSDQQRATASAERIRHRFAGHPSFPSAAPLTVSIGVAAYHDGEAPEEFIRRADRLLYLAKAQGKNRVCSGPEPAVVEPS